jgi:hypothetical protein
MLKHRLAEKVTVRLTETGDFDNAVTDIVARKMDPYTACDDLIRPVLDLFEKGTN